MTCSVKLLGAGALGVALSLSWAANAETVHRRHALQQAPAGHQITVHPRESFLTNGTGASVGAHNGYVLETFHPLQRETITGTFAAGRAMNSNRLPNRFTVPGSEEPLFTF